MRRLLFALFFALASAGAAIAQGAVEQSGPITSFHLPVWFANGFVGDAGTPAIPYVSNLGLYNGANCPFGISSATGGGTPPAQYAQFSVCQTATTTTFKIYGIGGLATPALYFDLGGTLYPFPGTGNGDVLGPSGAVDGDAACFNGTTGKIIKDCGANSNHLVRLVSGASYTILSSDQPNVTVAWKSGATSTKVTNLLACSASTQGNKVVVADDAGTASTYAIRVVPNGADTINLISGSYYIVFNSAAFGFICDGDGNWIVQ